MDCLLNRRSITACSVVALVSALVGPAVAQVPPDTTPVGPALRAEVLIGAAKLLEERYVFADSGRRFADVLRRRSADSSYAGVAAASAFAAMLTGDLRAMSHDKHLTILSPAMARAAFIGRGGTPDLAARAVAERARNYFFEEFRIMAGNVGYLRFRQFPVPDSSARATAVAAMRLLSNADAIILDLRDNRGGVEGFNQLLSSYFFTDTSRTLYQRYYREGDSTVSVKVLPQLEGPRMPATPLYILVNRGTGSAAENMAYALQTSGRATVIGEPTAGAANSSTILPLPGEFAMQVPVARVTSPVTGTNWEGVGVQPDVVTPPDSADAIAHRLAQHAKTLPEDPAPPKRIVMPAVVEVPLLGSNADGSARPVVEVRINGKGPYRFLVETGAPAVDITPALLDSLGLKLIGTADDGPQYHVDSLTIGAASFQDFTVTTLPEEVTKLGITGVLGLALYRNILLTVDYPAHTLRLSHDTLPAPNGTDILPLSRVSAFWGLPIRLGDRDYIGVLDTQNSRSLMIPPVVGDQITFDGGLQVVGKARGAFGTVDVKGGRLTGDLTIGRYTFPKPFLSVTQLPPEYPNQPNVGSGILSHFAVSLDQRSRRLLLARTGSTTIVLPGPAPTHAATPGRPDSASASALAAYAGVFGDRTIAYADGKLTLTRPGGQPNQLVRTASDTFGIAGIPEAKIVFSRDGTGAVTELRVQHGGGTWENAKRSGP